MTSQTPSCDRRIKGIYNQSKFVTFHRPYLELKTMFLRYDSNVKNNKFVCHRNITRWAFPFLSDHLFLLTYFKFHTIFLFCLYFIFCIFLSFSQLKNVMLLLVYRTSSCGQQVAYDQSRGSSSINNDSLRHRVSPLVRNSLQKYSNTRRPKKKIISTWDSLVKRIIPGAKRTF